MPRSALSFVDRVAVTTALAAALAAATAAATTWAIADHSGLGEVDAELRAAATAFSTEIATHSDTPLAALAEDESSEIRSNGLLIAVFDHGTFAGGERTLAGADTSGCTTVRSMRVRARRCAVDIESSRRIIVQGPLSRFDAHREVLALAALLAIVLATAAALASSHAVARWAVRPLTRLREAVERVRSDAPSQDWDPRPEGCAEVDAVRSRLTVLLARLDEALSHARRFAADAAHELRTPLATLYTEVELLRENARDDDESNAALARQQRTLAGLGALVERLLILAKPDERLGETGTTVALVDIVTESVASLAPARRARVAIEPVSDGNVRGDPALLRALVDNALDNALKFSGDSPVRVEVREEQGCVVLQVDDHGAGVPPDEREHVFEAFYRTRRARSGGPPGHGVGLALIAHVATAHGGSVRFADVAHGARLLVTLPAWSDDALRGQR